WADRSHLMTEEAGPLFQSSNIVRMFPTFVWKVELRPDVARPINDAILHSLGQTGAPLDDLDPGESWQSDHGLHEMPAFGGILPCINEGGERLLGYLKIGHSGFQITGCWANVNAPGAGHQVHDHPNNYLSGVYYVQTHEGADTVNFLDPRPQARTVRPPVTELTAENTEQVVLKIKDGMLLLFPAWLPHCVDPNRGNRARISLG